MSDEMKIASVWSGFEQPVIDRPRGFIGTGVPISPEYVLTCQHVIGNYVPKTRFFILIENGNEFIEVTPVAGDTSLDIAVLRILQPLPDSVIVRYPQLLSLRGCSYRELKAVELETKGYTVESVKQMKWVKWKDITFHTTPKIDQDGYPLEFQFSGRNGRGCSGSPLFARGRNGFPFLMGIFFRGGDDVPTCTVRAIDPICNYLKRLYDERKIIFTGCREVKGFSAVRLRRIGENKRIDEKTARLLKKSTVPIVIVLVLIAVTLFVSKKNPPSESEEKTVSVCICASLPGNGNRDHTVGSNAKGTSDERALQSLITVFNERNGIPYAHQPYPHEHFKDCLAMYLEECPDDVFSWVPGLQTQLFGDYLRKLPKKLYDDLKEKWPTSVKQVFYELNEDGYTLPFKRYPWAFYYRRSVWEKHGFNVPEDWKGLLDLLARMKEENLEPIAFGNRDLWPALGTFDILNMRINGVNFHTQLAGGKASWKSAEVKKVFEYWKQLLPYYAASSTGRWDTCPWEYGRELLERERAGMYFIGGFMVSDFDSTGRSDLRLFPFPEINPELGRESIDAPIDGFVVSGKCGDTPSAWKLIEFLGTEEAFTIYDKENPGFIAANSDVTYDSIHRGDRYLRVQEQADSLLKYTPKVGCFLDRQMKSQDQVKVVLDGIGAFLEHPDAVDGILDTIQSKLDSLRNSTNRSILMTE